MRVIVWILLRMPISLLLRDISPEIRGRIEALLITLTSFMCYICFPVSEENKRIK